MNSNQVAITTGERRVLLSDVVPNLAVALPPSLYEMQWIDAYLETNVRSKQTDFDVALVDLDQRDYESGLDLCRQLTTARPDAPVLVMTERRELETVIGAIRSGAYDFVTKPIDPVALERTIARALRHRELRSRLRRLTVAADGIRGFEDIIGESPAIQNVFEIVRRIACTDTSVLLTGESGTGKEVLASAIHRRSHRSERPFVGLNCGAVPPNLLESELFGHVKGAFTSARTSRPGLFVHAEGGTVLLDEIGEMPLEMQAKLLRVLQERRVRPVGGDKELPFDARIIAATNRDLEAAIAKGTFREDLYYRINVVKLCVPPLRDRGNDVLALARHFTKTAADRIGRPAPGMSSDCARRLSQYHWPGNVRELENAIERAVAMSDEEELSVSDLPPCVARANRTVNFQGKQDQSHLPTLSEVERTYIHHVLDTLKGNKTKAARVLGLDRRTLYRRLAKFKQTSQRSETLH